MASVEILSVSVEECESRVEKVRDFVREHDLAALLVYSGPKAHMWYQTGHVAYLTNWNNLDFFTDTIVVVPESGEAALLCPGLEYSMEMISRVSWMRDIRLVASPDPKSISTTFDEGMVGAESDMAGAGFGLEIKRVLNERGIGDKAIGVIGVENMPVPVHRELVAHLGERLTETEDIVARLRYIKSEAEIRIIRDTVALSDEVFGTIAEVLKPGMMGYELSAELEHYAKANGADFASYTLTSGPAENIEQGRLDVGRHLRKLEWGDQVQVNTYLVKNGYFVQPVRSGTVGPPSQQMRDLMGASNEIQDDIIAAMKPGVAIAEVCKAARDSAARLGCEGEWGRFGHGQGLDYGEWPYFQDTNTTPIEAGVVAVIHPPLFVPGSNNKFLYCGLGDVVLVTDSGAERLNQFPREPFHVGSEPERHILATVPVDPILHEGLGPLFPIVTAENDARETLLALMPKTVCLITRGTAPIDTEVMEAAPDLCLITRTGAGYENVDISAATALGIPVLHAPLLAEAVAEGTLAMMLALTKRLFYWHGSLLDGHWDRRIVERTDELYDKTLGIVGLGRIGRAVARRALGFDMRILACDPYVGEEEIDGLGVTLVALDELLASSDIVTLHALVTPETEGMIDRSNIGAIKRGAYLINFGRGALIDGLDIVYEALDKGHLAGVGLDVFPDEPPTNLDHPLFHHPSFIGSPHCLASTAGAEARCSHSVVRDVSAVLRGERPEWCINPEVFEASNLRPAALKGSW